MKTVRVALLGAGTVGGAFANLLRLHQDRLAALGAEVRLSRVLVRDKTKPRSTISSELLTDDADEMLQDCEVLVEVMGGTSLARTLVGQALEKKLPVITANKALLAEHWQALRPHAQAGRLYYEASVMAGTPVVSALSSIWGSRTLELHAILNGTTNYILSRLEAGTPYPQALAEAQAKGYAEADPTLDVEGFDAAHKLAVLARLTVDPEFPWEPLRQNTRGITALTPAHLSRAKNQGKAIRLVGSLYPEKGIWKGTVRPVLLPAEHPIARAGYQSNVLVYRGDAVGELVFTGAGAGGPTTASAVLNDLYRVLTGMPGHRPVPNALPATGVPAEKLEEV